MTPKINFHNNIQQLFEEQVRKTPQAIALTFKNHAMDYVTLNQKSNQLAHYLQTCGVQPETFVGICMDRSLDMVIGVLGILKAGGAYVPLDPTYPKDQLDFMLEDAHVSFLLTQEKFTSFFPQSQCLCLDTQWTSIAQYSPENPVSAVQPYHLAYVIYTSGSTGQAKGVLIEHAGLCNLAQAQIQIFGVHSDSKVLQFASLSFDVAIADIVMALCAGASLCLVTQETLSSPSTLLQTLQDQAITHLEIPVSVLNALPYVDLPHLQVLIVGGEACSQGIVATWSKGRRFFNAYGPTEATVCTTIAECEANDHPPPIGHPIPNMHVYILDTHLCSVPVGVTGELHIGGIGLARAYLNRPQLTAQKFISHPSYARLYKTGDLARYLPDGKIEFIGRIDRQVKIRGFRIELDHIEIMLSQHPKVRENAVVSIESDYHKYLVAYVVLSSPLDTNELRSFLKERLPPYMVPSTFVPIAELPLTPNGKLDRKTLTQKPIELFGKTPPQTLEEKQLAAIWSEILGLQKIGIHDNFFEMGGDSLKAMKLLSQLQKQLGYTLQLVDLHIAPTIAELGSDLKKHQQTYDDIIISSVPRDRNLPLSWVQEDIWTYHQAHPEECFYNLPMGFHLKGKLNQVSLEQSLNEMVSRHEILRTTFPVVGGHPIQHISQQKKIEIHVIDLTYSPNTLEQWFIQESQRNFNLLEGPLWFVTLLHLAQDHYVLLFCMHHMIIDGWSAKIFLDEFVHFYETFSTNQLSKLPVLPIQYADFAYWQRQTLTQEALEKRYRYWEHLLAKESPLLPLTPHKMQSLDAMSEIGTMECSLPPHLIQQLKEIKQVGTSFFVMILTAFVTLLHHYSGCPDIVIGVPMNKRYLDILEPLIGHFSRILILRIDLGNKPNFLELLSQVHQVMLSAITHQDITFEQLMNHFPQQFNHPPKYQTLINFIPLPRKEIKLTELMITPIPIDKTVMFFDLVLWMWEENTSEGLSLKTLWRYKKDLFSILTMAQIVKHFENLLEQIVRDPTQ